MSGDKVVDEIKLHEQTIASDSNSPLHLIREKELEISGRMLSAKREADQVVADARRKAAEIVAAAEAEGGAGAKASAGSAVDQATVQAAELRSGAQADAASMTTAAEARRAAAVDIIIQAVTTV